MVHQQHVIPLAAGIGVAIVVVADAAESAGGGRYLRCAIGGVGIAFGDSAAGIGQSGDGVLLAAVVIEHLGSRGLVANHRRKEACGLEVSADTKGCV